MSSCKNSNITKNMRCCLDNCKPVVDLCYNKCNNSFPTQNKPRQYKLCNDVCDYIAQSCTETCKLESDMWQLGNPFETAVKETGCTTEKCLNENKYEILKKCRKNCYPSSNVDCTDYCAFSYDMLTTPYYISNKQYAEHYNEQGTKKKYLIILFIIILLVCISLFFSH